MIAPVVFQPSEGEVGLLIGLRGASSMQSSVKGSTADQSKENISMTKKSILLLVLALSLSSWALAAPAKSWTGTVSDEHCGVKHAAAGDAAAACVKKCATGGAKYVLVSKGKVYNVDNQDKF